MDTEPHDDPGPDETGPQPTGDLSSGSPPDPAAADDARPTFDPSRVRHLGDGTLTIAQLARNMIWSWTHRRGDGDWDRAMAAELDAHPVALRHPRQFDGTCQRCGASCREADHDAVVWACDACGWRVELVAAH